MKEILINFAHPVQSRSKINNALCAANIDVLRKFGREVYYGDSTRLDLLESAGAADAQLLIIRFA